MKIDKIFKELEREIQITLIINMLKNGNTIIDWAGYTYRCDTDIADCKENYPVEVIEPDSENGIFYSYEVAANSILENLDM